MSQLLKYAPEINSIATAKGFWDAGVQRNKGEMVMLIVSELGECMEAHRKNRRFDNKNLEIINFLNTGKALDGGIVEEIQWQSVFKERCKDSVEDELADAVIRILDYVHGWNIPVIEREFRKKSTGNFGHDLLRINWYIIQAFHQAESEALQYAQYEVSTYGKDWDYVLVVIEKFAEHWNINLEQHVIWKMRYNNTRPKLHGKTY